MLRKKLTDIFTTPQSLVNKAAALHQSLRSYAISPEDVPLSVLQLGSLYKKILENDRDSLQKRLQHPKGDSNPEVTQATLEALNKLLIYDFIDGQVDKNILHSQLEESRHLNDCLAFIRERRAYVAEIKQYLLDMKSDIETTPWKSYVTMNIAQAENYLMRSRDSDADSDDDTFAEHDREYWQRTGEYAYRWEDRRPSWAEKIKFELEDLSADRTIAPGKLLNTYHKIIQLINNVKDSHMHAEAYDFLKQHRGEIASISYLPLHHENKARISK
jgi:hypothetical protein